LKDFNCIDFEKNLFIVKQVENNHCDLSVFVGL